jgi:hypothetical protein
VTIKIIVITELDYGNMSHVKDSESLDCLRDVANRELREINHGMMYEDDPVIPFVMIVFQFCDDIEDGNSGLDFSLATEGRMLGESSYLTFDAEPQS